MPAPVRVISSMATSQLLAALIDLYRGATGHAVELISVGGVDAAKRVQAGEMFDLVVLAGDAIGKLAAAGHVRADTVRAIVDSSVAVAVREGDPQPDIGSEAALRQAVLAARSIGYSTGPSGTALLQLFERWGLHDVLKDRLVQARPGVPVGSLVADGMAQLGFQQLSELMGVKGVVVLGGMPEPLAITTTFCGAVAGASAAPSLALELLAFMCDPDKADTKHRHGMAVPGG